MGMRVIMVLLGLTAILAWLSGCGTGNAGPRFTVSGTVVTTAGVFPTGLEASLIDSNGFTAGGGIVTSNGNFTTTSVPAGTYTLLIEETLNGVPVRIETGPIIITNADIVLPQIIIPVAQDLSPIGTPLRAALAVFVRNVNELLVPATVQISGVSGIFGPAAPVLIPSVPAGIRDVTVIAGGQTFVQRNVTFITGTITVLNFNVGQQPGTSLVTGMVENSIGIPLVGTTVALFSDGVKMAQTATVSGGNFTFSGIQPGTYTVVVTNAINGIPIVTNSLAFRVIDMNILLPPIIVPTAADIAPIGVPFNGALVVFSRDTNNAPVPATVVIQDVTGMFGTGSTVVVADVPVGLHDVSVTSSTQTVVSPGLNFSAGMITVLDATFTGI